MYGLVWSLVAFTALHSLPRAHASACAPLLGARRSVTSREVSQIGRSWLDRPAALEGLYPADRARALTQSMRARLGGKPSTRTSPAEYERFFRALRRSEVPDGEVCALLRQAMEYETFGLEAGVIADLGLSDDGVDEAFRGVDSRRIVRVMHRTGLWSRVSDARRFAIAIDVARRWGWTAFAMMRELLPSRQIELFAATLISPATRFDHQVAAQMLDFARSTHATSAERSTLLLTMARTSRFELNNGLIDGLRAFDVPADVREELADILLRNVNQRQITGLLDRHPEFGDVRVLFALRRLLEISANFRVPHELVDVAAKHLKSSHYRMAFLTDLADHIGPRHFVHVNLSPFAVTASQRWFLLSTYVNQYEEPAIEEVIRRMDVGPNHRTLAARYRLGTKPRSSLLAMQPRQVAEGVIGAPELKRLLSMLQASNPTVLSPREAAIPWDRVLKADVGLGLLRVLMRRLDNPEFGRSIEVVSDMLFGVVDPEFVRVAERASTDRLGTLYELALDIYERTRGTPLFAGAGAGAPEPALWEKRNLAATTELLAAIRDRLLVDRDLDFGGVVIGPGNVATVTAGLRDQMVAQVHGLFANLTVPLTTDRLGRLQERWGDLSPIFTLAARFAAKRHWRIELDVTARIFETSIDGSFADYKYRGFPGDAEDRAAAARQLAPLATAAAQETWRRNFFRVGTANAIAGDRDRLDVARVEAARAIMTSNLRIHARDQSRPGRAEVESLLALEDADGIERRASAILGREVELRLTAQIRDDLRAIVAALSDPGGESRGELVVTTAIDDAKTLLMVGDLVNTSSCQNYRTGSHVHTLPSYVIDANVKALASFVVGSRYFASVGEFERVRAGVAGLRDVVFDGDRRRFVFTLADGSAITTDSLDRAHRRHILRLGRAQSGAPSLVLERAYLQVHPATALMVDQVESIVAEYAERLGASRGVYTTFAASRNPRGGYTDAGGGVKIGPYSTK